MSFTHGEIKHRKGGYSSVKQKYLWEELNTDLMSEDNIMSSRAFLDTLWQSTLLLLLYNGIFLLLFSGRGQLNTYLPYSFFTICLCHVFLCLHVHCDYCRCYDYCRCHKTWIITGRSNAVAAQVDAHLYMGSKCSMQFEWYKLQFWAGLWKSIFTASMWTKGNESSFAGPAGHR